MTAEINLGVNMEKIVVQNGQSTEFDGVIIFSQKDSTWVHPVDGAFLQKGAVKVKDGAVGLYKAGSSVVLANDLTVEHI